MRSHNGMKPQDCVILLKIIDYGSSPWMAKELAQAAGLSPGEVSFSLERSRYAMLLNESKRRVNTRAFLDFLVHGLRVVFPVHVGGIVRGIPTAWSASPLSRSFPDANPVVWPSDQGTLRGESIEPLYANSIASLIEQPSFHELLALVDALRIGRAREADLASKILRERFDEYARLAEH
mgnify:CR=1 FL=1